MSGRHPQVKSVGSNRQPGFLYNISRRIPARHKVLAAVCLALVLASNRVTAEHIVLTDEGQQEACARADMKLIQNKGLGGSQAVRILKPGKKPEKYLPKFEDETVKKALKLGKGTLVLLSTDTTTLGANETLFEAAKRLGFEPAQLECLNGVDAKSRLGQSSSIAIASETKLDGASGHVVSQGETVNSITGDNQELAEGLNVEPTKLPVGSVLALQPVFGVGPENTPSDKKEIVTVPSQTKEFVEKYGDYAQEVEDKYGVPRAVVLAMAEHESGYGRSELAKKANNFHGLKAKADNGWTGETYTKLTKEHVLAKDKDRYKSSMVGEPIDLGNGYVEITIKDTFKKFQTTRDGFLDFGSYLMNRKVSGELAYADAFEIYKKTGNPKDFIDALFDNIGPARYATDTGYIKKVGNNLAEVQAALSAPVKQQAEEGQRSQEENGPSINAEEAWGSISGYQRGLYESKEIFIKSYNTAWSAEISAKGFEEFKNNIEDISSQIAAEHPEYIRPSGNKDSKNYMFGEDQYLTTEEPRMTFHYTAWPPEIWDYDAWKFLSSLHNTGKGGSSDYYLSRDGKKLWVLTDGKHMSHHAAGDADKFPDTYKTYNQTARGVETPSLTQGDISGAQYEGLVYTVLYQLYKDQPGLKGKVLDYDFFKKYVIGHGEISEFGNVGSTHRDFPESVTDVVAFKSWELHSALVRAATGSDRGARRGNVNEPQASSRGVMRRIASDELELYTKAAENAGLRLSVVGTYKPKGKTIVQVTPGPGSAKLSTEELLKFSLSLMTKK